MTHPTALQQTTADAGEVSASAYSVLATCYDQLMEHVDYHDWADFVYKAFQRFQHKPQRILELAAGHLRFAQEFLEHPKRPNPVEYFATDLSSQMLFEGLRRLKSEAPEQLSCLQTQVCDYRQIQDLPGEFDTLISLYDSVNYCLQAQERLDLGKAWAAKASPGALLIFDAVAPLTCREWFDEGSQVEHLVDGRFLVREFKWNQLESLQSNVFHLFAPIEGSKLWTCEVERHLQWVPELTLWKKLFASDAWSDWELLGITHERTLAKAKAESERWHFILRRKP